MAPGISAADITIVVPVRDNQLGVDHVLKPRRACNARHGREAESSLWTRTPCHPSRLLGQREREATTVDSDCVLTVETIPGFVAASNGAIAYAGSVRALDTGIFAG